MIPPLKHPTRCLVAFGSNQGPSRAIWQQVNQSFRECPWLELVATSNTWETTPVGGPEGQNLYLNAAMLVLSHRSAEETHEFLMDLEHHLGRVRRKRWDRRNVDLDLLLFEDAVLTRPNLIIPHPRMTFRRFVLKPAAEIVPEMVHPVCGLTVQGLMDRIDRPSLEVVWVIDERSDTSKLRKQLAERFGEWRFTILSQRQFEDTLARPRLTVLQAIVQKSCLKGPYLDLMGLGTHDPFEEVAAALESIGEDDGDR